MGSSHEAFETFVKETSSPHVYKKVFPTAWILSTPLGQDKNKDVTVSGIDDSDTTELRADTASLFLPHASGGIVAAPTTSSTAGKPTANVKAEHSYDETEQKREDEAQPAEVSTLTSETNKHDRPSRELGSKPSPSKKSKLWSKTKELLKGGSSQRQSKVQKGGASPKIEFEELKQGETQMLPKATATEELVLTPSTDKFRWPATTSPAVDTPTFTTTDRPSPTSGLKFQPKQLEPQPAKASSIAAPSTQQLPPAPIANANSGRYTFSATGQNHSGVSRSSRLAHPMSAASGFSASTTSDLADVPSRLPHQSAGYSPGYSARS
ncbi:MAG: hypothetical protein Q9195_006913 [Heterodermia aff. obscurata]